MEEYTHLVGTACAERYSQTHNETEDGKEEGIDDQRIDELRDARDCCGPDGNEQERNNHPRRDAARKA